MPAVRTAVWTAVWSGDAVGRDRPAWRSRGDRRRYVASATSGVLLAGLALTGCTGGDDEPPEPGPTPESSSAAPAAPEELRLTVFGTDAQQASYEDVAAGFERTRDDVDVVVDGYPTAEAALRAVEQGEVEPDVFLLDAPDLLQPLDELLEERDVQFGDDHQRVALAELSANAALQCMPAEMSPLVLYANEDLLPPKRRLRSLDVDLPRAIETWGWNDFAATARAVAVADGPEGVRGTYVPPTLETVTAFVRAAGADVVDDVVEPSVVDLTSDEALQVLRLVAVLAADRTVSPTPDEIAERDALDRFLGEQLGLYVGTRADVPVLRDAGIDFRVLPMPGFGRSRDVSRVSGYCVPAASPHVELAADFIAWAVSQQGAATAARGGALVPARLDTLSAPAFTQPGRLPSNYRVYADGVRRSEPLPQTPEWEALNRLTDRTLRQVLTDPTLDLGLALPARLERLERRSERLLEPEETESPSPEESDSPS